MLGEDACWLTGAELSYRQQFWTLAGPCVRPSVGRRSPTAVTAPVAGLLSAVNGAYRVTSGASAGGRRAKEGEAGGVDDAFSCLLYTSPSPRDRQKSRMPSSA